MVLGEDDHGQRGLLHHPLEPYPGRRWQAPRVPLGYADEVEHRHLEQSRLDQRGEGD
jgi:hypothetical protein